MHGRITNRVAARILLLALGLLGLGVPGCRTARERREATDAQAVRTLTAAQEQALGRSEAIAIESAADTLRKRLMQDHALPHAGPASLGVHDLPAAPYWAGGDHLNAGDNAPVLGTTGTVLRINLVEAIQIGARNSREFQDAKEALYRAALGLDLERDAFRSTLASSLAGGLEHDRTAVNDADDADEKDETGVRGIGRDDDGEVSRARGEARLGAARKFRNGIELAGSVGADLVKLLTQDAASALGLAADASVTIPLLRGSGALVAAEPLEQAERDLVYAVYAFERFKRGFAVRVAQDYLGVLQEGRNIVDVEKNYKSLMAGTRRARRLADAGLLPEFQHDQAVQDELRARTRWIESRQRYASRLESFRVQLGLPPEAPVELDAADLDQLYAVAERFRASAAETSGGGEVPPADADIVLVEPGREGAGPLELMPDVAMQLGLESRLDLRTAQGRVEDAQRGVYVAADALRAELTLLGRASAVGREESGDDGNDVNLRPDRGLYTGLLTLDLPLERTQEQVAYRNSLMALEAAVRALQETEDRLKLEVRQTLRDLRVSREGLRIQLEAVALAEKRVRSTELFLQAGRVQVRDVLESQEALLSTQNALTAAVVNYRLAELALQRDLDVLQVSAEGLWQEYVPGE